MDKYITIAKVNSKKNASQDVACTSPSTVGSNLSKNSKQTINSPNHILQLKENPPVSIIARKQLPQAFTSWQKTYPWLSCNQECRAVCKICVEAVSKEMVLPTDTAGVACREAFVVQGFITWKNAITAFKNHEKSGFHRAAFLAVESFKQVNIKELISTAAREEMIESRKALEKIFSTVNFLARQGLALRGHGTDEHSNFRQLLETRAEDCPLLQKWLSRTGYKWIHHDVTDEIVEMISRKIIENHLAEIKTAKYFSIIIDETSDVCRVEQISLSIRIVSSDLMIKEVFLGFYETSNTKSETLHQIVTNVIKDFGLDLKNLRGQCFDGAANVSGKISGLQARLRKDEPRAIYVHCKPHKLNLCVQDGMEKIFCAKDFIGIAKELINFIRDSPKRLAIFKDLQSDNAPMLSPFCATRWCVRVKSLKTLYTNYTSCIKFFKDIIDDPDTEAGAMAKARGFLKSLRDFQFHFLLVAMINIFERVEVLNQNLQKSDMNIMESQQKVLAVIDSLKELRMTGFDTLWSDTINKIEKLGVEDPKMPRSRKIPKRLDSESTAHEFTSSSKYFRQIYFEILDQVIMSMTCRFESPEMKFLTDAESFIIGREGKDGTKVSMDTITSFYNINEERELDAEKLALHVQMFQDILRQKDVKVSGLKDVVTFLQSNNAVLCILPELVKLIRLILVIPFSACTAERSFSTLRRLKTYLRSSMKQARLNALTIIHVHADDAKELNLKIIIDEFINRNKIRQNTFALSK